MKTNNKIFNLKIFNLIIFNLIIFNLINLQSGNAQMFWNQACQFAGSSGSYVAVPNSSTINITGSFTIEAWLNPSTLSGNSKGIVAKGGILGSLLEYGMRLNSTGRISLFTNGAVRLPSRASNSIPINTWTHVAGSYNSATNQFRIYINGGIDTISIIAAAAPPSNTDSLFIGISGSTTPFSGQMDEVRLWNRELSPTEVSQYFRTSLSANTGIYSGLIMSITFQGNNSSSSFILTDLTGNSNNGFNRGVTGVDQRNRPYLTIMPNESAEFDGTEDYLAAPDAATISPTTAITLECWVYPRSLNPFLFMTKGSNYRLSYNGAHVSFGINNNFFGTGVGLPINRWSHVALAYTASSGRYFFYLNGNLLNTGSINLGNIIDGTDSLYIGGGPGGFGDLNGFLDEVRISDYAKSQPEINNFLYQSIDNANDPNLPLTNIVFNLDGYSTSSANTAPRLSFRNNARFSHPGIIANQPVSPLNRNDNSNFSEGYYIKTSNKRIPTSGTSGSIIDSTIINLNATITDVNLFVALNHTNSGNIDIVLVAPNNDSVKVFDSKLTPSSDDNLITIFNDQADSSLINNRYSSFTPIIKPENNMNAIFSGDNTQGRWKLIVRDETTNDTGFLYAWGIQLNNLSQRPKDLNISVLMEGFYNSSTNLMIPDTMKVYIMGINPPRGLSFDSSKTLLNSSGSGLCSFSGDINNNQQYFIQLRHRNSIETWSNTFSFVNDEASYSFISADSAAFGSNQIQVDNSPVRFAIYGGDVDQDGSVDATDLALIENDAFNFVTGYVVTDITGNNFVDASDGAIADNNAFNFVTVIRP